MLARAEREIGVAADFIALGARRRIVELFLPWHFVGHNVLTAEPPVGTCLGLVLGYNDQDAARGGARGRNLRWPHGLDPWHVPARREGSPRPWGDLLIAPALRGP